MAKRRTCYDFLVQNIPPIIISGSIAIDRIMNFGGHFPDYLKADKLHSLSISIFLDSLRDTAGGVGANIAYSVALLGDRPILLGCVGKADRTYIDELKKLGVNTTHIHFSDLPTASFNVITDGADRQIGGFYPGAMFDSASLVLEPWKTKAPLVVISPHDPNAMRRQVEECKLYNLRLFYDVGQQVSNISASDIKAGLQISELLIVNDYELAIICDKIGQTEKQLKSKIPVVVTTFGGDGSVIDGAKMAQPIKIGVAKPAKVLDPTGAGDAYRAGFLHGYIRDWQLKACAQLGAVCAAYAIEHLGTQAHHFSPTSVATSYQSAFNEKLPE